MNIAATSKEAILKASIELVAEKGLSAVNMRAVADICGVAVGSIYNYFPSKSDLICAAVEAVWKDIFHTAQNSMDFKSFEDCILWLFKTISKSSAQYPEFFALHSISFTSENKEGGRQLMKKYFGHLRERLLVVLKNDKNVRENAFNENFTREEFTDYVFTLLISLLLKNQNDCRVLLEIIKRCIYI